MILQVTVDLRGLESKQSEVNAKREELARGEAASAVGAAWSCWSFSHRNRWRVGIKMGTWEGEQSWSEKLCEVNFWEFFFFFSETWVHCFDWCYIMTPDLSHHICSMIFKGVGFFSRPFSIFLFWLLILSLLRISVVTSKLTKRRFYCYCFGADYFRRHWIRQSIATSAEVTRKGSLGRESYPKWP